MICPLCKSNKNTIQFEKCIYIEDEDGNYSASGMYGCKQCNIVFANKVKNGISIKPEDPQNKTVDKVQNIFGNIAKGCNKILSNIK
jgi:hypothetical protein